jgi:hypothetical protein
MFDGLMKKSIRQVRDFEL